MEKETAAEIKKEIEEDIEEKIEEKIEEEHKYCFWYNLERKYPLEYVISQIAILAISIASIIISIAEMSTLRK